MLMCPFPNGYHGSQKVSARDDAFELEMTSNSPTTVDPDIFGLEMTPNSLSNVDLDVLGSEYKRVSKGLCSEEFSRSSSSQSCLITSRLKASAEDILLIQFSKASRTSQPLESQDWKLARRLPHCSVTFAWTVVPQAL